jgi:biofilm PGA synthesis N-glycosyltransferase PgaC
MALVGATVWSPLQVVCAALFVVACCTLFYTLVGYPLLLGWIARKHNNPVAKDEHLRSVSFVIAVHNGEKFLQRKLDTIFGLNYPRELMEILIVSDGSTDRTDEIAQAFAAQGVRFLAVPRAGKSAALNAAIPMLSGEILVLTDIRQTLDPDCLRNVIACFGDPKVGAVSAELHVVDERTHEEFYTDLYWRYELWQRQRMSRIDSSFGCTGAFYAVRRELWTPFPPGLLVDDAYLPLTVFFRGYRVIYEPTSKIYDFPTALGSEFRRKVRTQAGLYQLLRLMPELLSSRNRMRLHFLSGKYGRIVMPYCLIVIALTTFGLPPLWRNIALAIQLFCYGLAALDLLIPAGFPLKRLTAPFRVFVVLMASSLLGARVFFVSPQSLWKQTIR